MISHLEQDTLLRYLRDAPAVLAQSHYNIISHPDAILALHRDKRMAIVSPIGLAIIGRLASLDRKSVV